MAVDLDAAAQTTSYLRRLFIFENLAEQELAMLASTIQSKLLQKGENMIRDGERSDSLYLVIQGMVKLSKNSAGGEEQILRFLFSGDFFGQLAVLLDIPHNANAEAIEVSVVYQVPKHEWKQLLVRNPDVTYRLFLAVSEQLHQADEWLGAMSLLEVEHRVAKILDFLHNKRPSAYGAHDILVAKKELAAMIGITPGTLSGKLAYLEELNIIALKNRKIRVLDPLRLSRLAGQSFY